MTRPVRRPSRLGVQELEDRTTPAVGDLYISEVHFSPSNSAGTTQNQYLEFRGQPNATIRAGTYLAVVNGDPVLGTSTGVINSLFDLSGLKLGSDGYLVILQSTGSYSVNPTATVLRGTNGFGGLPGNRFTDNSTLSNSFEFIFNSNTFMLVEAPVAPVAADDVDINDDGLLDGAASTWTVLDSVGVLGTFINGSANDISYGQITFLNGGLGSTPAGSTAVPMGDFGYVARVGESTGFAPADWVAAPTAIPIFSTGQYVLDANASGSPSQPVFAGRALNHLGTANFVASIEGDKFNDLNGDGVRGAGEEWASGTGLTPPVTIYVDRNGDRALGSYTTVVEPDAVPSSIFNSISNAFNGVTLTVADGANVQVDTDVYSFAGSGATTGQRLFFNNFLTNWTSTRRLRMDLYKPAQSVSLDFIATGVANTFGRLAVYAADGTLLQTVVSGALTTAAGGQRAVTLTIGRPTADIAYAVAYADPAGSNTIALDNMRFSQPEDSAVTDANGHYRIDYLQDATYTLREVRVPNYLLTYPDFAFHSVPIFGNVPARGWDFGNTPGATVGVGIGGSRLTISSGPGQLYTLDLNRFGQFEVTTALSLPAIPSVAADFNNVPVRMAAGDVNGDGTADFVLVTGPGTPLRFAVIDGSDSQNVLVLPTAPFAGSENFTGGGFVALGDVDGDGRADMVFTPDEGGGPRVTIFSLLGSGLRLRANFFGINDASFRGGARPAVGDVNGDGTADVVIAAGFGGGPRVAVFDGRGVLGSRGRLIGDFFAFPDVLRNGVYVSIGDVDGDRFGDLVFGAGPGGGPQVFVISGRVLVQQGAAAAVASPLANFFDGDENNRGGVRVTVKDPDRDGLADVVTGSGAGQQGIIHLFTAARLRAGQTAPAQTIDPFYPFLADTTEGVYVG